MHQAAAAGHVIEPWPAEQVGRPASASMCGLIASASLQCVRLYMHCGISRCLLRLRLCRTPMPTTSKALQSTLPGLLCSETLHPYQDAPTRAIAQLAIKPTVPNCASSLAGYRAAGAAAQRRCAVHPERGGQGRRRRAGAAAALGAADRGGGRRAGAGVQGAAGAGKSRAQRQAGALRAPYPTIIISGHVRYDTGQILFAATFVCLHSLPYNANSLLTLW